MDQDTVICRCESVTLADIVRAVEGGARTAREVKNATRAGMGACQGRTCRLAIDAVLKAMLGEGDTDVRALSFRIPVRPVPLGELSELKLPSETELAERRVRDGVSD